MSNTDDSTKYDDVLTTILVNEKSILGFLSAIFNFLARRTDFYYVPEGPYESMGFPPGVAEELVIKVLRKCDPKQWQGPKIFENKPQDLNNEIMCSTVAQEVEVIAEEDLENADSLEPINVTENPSDKPINIENKENINTPSISSSVKTEKKQAQIPEDYEPPVIPTQKNSDSYNGAEREKYTWSQTIMELDVTARLPPDIKSAKELKVLINPGDISVSHRNGTVIFKDKLPYKIKTIESFWSVSEGKLLIHLEKIQERWWDRLLNSEEPIDLSKIDCSRPLDELPEDHVAKVRELQWNQERKMKGLPTSDEIRNVGILKKAWNAPGSPFQGQEFDPSILKSPDELLKPK